MKKRFLSIALILSMLLSIVPLTPVVATTETVTPTTVAKDITLGTSAIQEPTEVTNNSETYYTPNSYIYFGKNGATDIKWRVLDADKANDGKTDGMFLLSEYVLATGIRFNGNGSKGNQYQGSVAQNWCKNFAEDLANFSPAEQKAMFGVEKPDSTEVLYSIKWGASSLTTEDKLFFLSARELANYVGNYDEAPGLAATTDASKESVWWWLRSPIANTTNRAGVVIYDGVVFDNYVGDYYGVRPALNLNPASVLFTSAAKGGKSSDAVGGVTENKNYGDIKSNDGYKLTLLDESHSGFSAYLKSLSGTTATVSYSGATTGTNEYISVIIKNGNDVKYYGRVCKAASASGDVDITLPDDYSMANGDVLCVFNEQYNGNDTTDYASKLIDVMPFDYTVIFNANGGDGTMASQTMTYATTSSLSANTFTKSGYTFNGWNTKSDGNGTAYSDEQSVTNLVSDASTPSVTLYAQWKDTTAPIGEIKLGTNSWKTFLNNITFGLFFKSVEEVTITATDNGGEDVKIEYLLSDKELTAEELATATFTAYSDKFTVEPNNEYVIYAKLSDKTGNVAYINSNGIVLDNIAPVISGITNGETYCAAQTVTVSDKYEVTVTVNGTPVTLDANGQFTLSPASGTQTVVATDKAGNVSAEMIITVNDGANHTTLKHIEAKAATTEAEGNIEYWHCKDCGKYFSDKDGKNEITLAETVIAKLSDNKTPQTGDNSHMALWFALLFVSGGLLTVTGAYSKKRKYSSK